MKKSSSFVFGLLLLTAASSMAMSLGRHSGATLIGRPLDISILAELKADEDAGSLCLEADVFYADNKIDKSRVRVTLERSASESRQALIRIRSTALVDEPVVTLYVRAGCQQKVERRYVSLAELVPETISDRNSSAPMPRAAPVRPAVVPALNATTSTVEAAPVLQAKEPQTPRTKPPRASNAAQGNKAAAPVNSRLKLEMLDLTIVRDPQLKASAELLSIPAADPKERAAASALWRALSAQPQDILRDTEKLQALENSVRGLQAQSQKTLVSIDDLNVRLQQAQAERYANPLFYTLIALLLLTLAGLVYLLRHRLLRGRGESGDKPWWRKSEAYQSQHAAWVDSQPSPGLDDPHASSSSRFRSVHKSVPVDLNTDDDLVHDGSRSGSARHMANPIFVDSAPWASKDRSDFGASSLHPSRAVMAEELFDVQQQADFFVSIGQHEQAIEVLRSNIAENPEPSALVYLDLFNLYHQLNRPEEYENLRPTFNQCFNTQIPSFEMYSDNNLGLEAYQQALSRIEALWPSQKVLEIIEESLFRKADHKSQTFNLEAYRELLMLYSIAKEIISADPIPVVSAQKFDLPDRPADSANSGPMTFMSTAIQPLSASMDANQRAGHGRLIEPLTASVIPPASHRLGLDIDLSKLSAQDDKADSLRPSDAQFFAKLDADAPSAVSTPDSTRLPPARGATDTDYLMDFDAFDMPLAVSEKSKPPKA